MPSLRSIVASGGLICAFLTAGAPVALAQNGNLQRAPSELFLLQPLDGGSNTLPPEPGIGIFFTYFNRAWPYLVGSAAGVAVLQGVVGGVQIMMSSGGGGKEAGVERLKWSIAGLVTLVLAGFILRTLNPLFYV